MAKWNCYVLYIKKRKCRDKIKYELIDYEVYPNISKELAFYLAVKKDCGLSGFTGKKPCHPMKGKQIIGFHQWCNDVIVCQISKIQTSDINKIIGSDISIYPQINNISFRANKSDFSESISNLVSHYENGVFADFSIDAFNIWAPNNLIPKGYDHITSGEVQEGDYYFDSKTHSNSLDTWLSVDVSFSGYKPSRKIELRGVKYVGDNHRYRDNGEVVNYYQPFIIRKRI